MNPRENYPLSVASRSLSQGPRQNKLVSTTKTDPTTRPYVGVGRSRRSTRLVYGTGPMPPCQACVLKGLPRGTTPGPQASESTRHLKPQDPYCERWLVSTNDRRGTMAETVPQARTQQIGTMMIPVTDQDHIGAQ